MFHEKTQSYVFNPSKKTWTWLEISSEVMKCMKKKNSELPSFFPVLKPNTQTVSGKFTREQIKYGRVRYKITQSVFQKLRLHKNNNNTASSVSSSQLTRWIMTQIEHDTRRRLHQRRHRSIKQAGFGAWVSKKPELSQPQLLVPEQESQFVADYREKYPINMNEVTDYFTKLQTINNNLSEDTYVRYSNEFDEIRALLEKLKETAYVDLNAIVSRDQQKNVLTNIEEKQLDAFISDHSVYINELNNTVHFADFIKIKLDHCKTVYEESDFTSQVNQKLNMFEFDIKKVSIDTYLENVILYFQSIYHDFCKQRKFSEPYPPLPKVFSITELTKKIQEEYKKYVNKIKDILLENTSVDVSEYNKQIYKNIAYVVERYKLIKKNYCIDSLYNTTTNETKNFSTYVEKNTEFNKIVAISQLDFNYTNDGALLDVWVAKEKTQIHADILNKIKDSTDIYDHIVSKQLTTKINNVSVVHDLFPDSSALDSKMIEDIHEKLKIYYEDMKTKKDTKQKETDDVIQISSHDSIELNNIQIELEKTEKTYSDEIENTVFDINTLDALTLNDDIEKLTDVYHSIKNNTYLCNVFFQDLIAHAWLHFKSNDGLNMNLIERYKTNLKYIHGLLSKDRQLKPESNAYFNETIIKYDLLQKFLSLLDQSSYMDPKKDSDIEKLFQKMYLIYDVKYVNDHVKEIEKHHIDQLHKKCTTENRKSVQDKIEKLKHSPITIQQLKELKQIPLKCQSEETKPYHDLLTTTYTIWYNQQIIKTINDLHATNITGNIQKATDNAELKKVFEAYEKIYKKINPIFLVEHLKNEHEHILKLYKERVLFLSKKETYSEPDIKLFFQNADLSELFNNIKHYYIEHVHLTHNVTKFTHFIFTLIESNLLKHKSVPSLANDWNQLFIYLSTFLPFDVEDKNKIKSIMNTVFVEDTHKTWKLKSLVELKALHPVIPEQRVLLARFIENRTLNLLNFEEHIRMIQITGLNELIQKIDKKASGLYKDLNVLLEKYKKKKQALNQKNINELKTFKNTEAIELFWNGLPFDEQVEIVKEYLSIKTKLNKLKKKPNQTHSYDKVLKEIIASSDSPTLQKDKITNLQCVSCENDLNERNIFNDLKKNLLKYFDIIIEYKAPPNAFNVKSLREKIQVEVNFKNLHKYFGKNVFSLFEKYITAYNDEFLSKPITEKYKYYFEILPYIENETLFASSYKRILKTFNKQLSLLSRESLKTLKQDIITVHKQYIDDIRRSSKKFNEKINQEIKEHLDQQKKEYRVEETQKTQSLKDFQARQDAQSSKIKDIVDLMNDQTLTFFNEISNESDTSITPSSPTQSDKHEISISPSSSSEITGNENESATQSITNTDTTLPTKEETVGFGKRKKYKKRKSINKKNNCVALKNEQKKYAETLNHKLEIIEQKLNDYKKDHEANELCQLLNQQVQSIEQKLNEIRLQLKQISLHKNDTFANIAFDTLINSQKDDSDTLFLNANKSIDFWNNDNKCNSTNFSAPLSRQFWRDPEPKHRKPKPTHDFARTSKPTTFFTQPSSSPTPTLTQTPPTSTFFTQPSSSPTSTFLKQSSASPTLTQTSPTFTSPTFIQTPPTPTIFKQPSSTFTRFVPTQKPTQSNTSSFFSTSPLNEKPLFVDSLHLPRSNFWDIYSTQTKQQPLLNTTNSNDSVLNNLIDNNMIQFNQLNSDVFTGSETECKHVFSLNKTPDFKSDISPSIQKLSQTDDDKKIRIQKKTPSDLTEREKYEERKKIYYQDKQQNEKKRLEEQEQPLNKYEARQRFLNEPKQLPFTTYRNAPELTSPSENKQSYQKLSKYHRKKFKNNTDFVTEQQQQSEAERDRFELERQEKDTETTEGRKRQHMLSEAERDRFDLERQEVDAKTSEGRRKRQRMLSEAKRDRFELERQNIQDQNNEEKKRRHLLSEAARDKLDFEQRQIKEQIAQAAKEEQTQNKYAKSKMQTQNQQNMELMEQTKKEEQFKYQQFVLKQKYEDAQQIKNKKTEYQNKIKYPSQEHMKETPLQRIDDEQNRDELVMQHEQYKTERQHERLANYNQSKFESELNANIEKINKSMNDQTKKIDDLQLKINILQKTHDEKHPNIVSKEELDEHHNINKNIKEMNDKTIQIQRDITQAQMDLKKQQESSIIQSESFKQVIETNNTKIDQLEQAVKQLHTDIKNGAISKQRQDATPNILIEHDDSTQKLKVLEKEIEKINTQLSLLQQRGLLESKKPRYDDVSNELNKLEISINELKNMKNSKPISDTFHDERQQIDTKKIEELNKRINTLEHGHDVKDTERQQIDAKKIEELNKRINTLEHGHDVKDTERQQIDAKKIEELNKRINTLEHGHDVKDTERQQFDTKKIEELNKRINTLEHGHDVKDIPTNVERQQIDTKKIEELNKRINTLEHGHDVKDAATIIEPLRKQIDVLEQHEENHDQEMKKLEEMIDDLKNKQSGHLEQNRDQDNQKIVFLVNQMHALEQKQVLNEQDNRKLEILDKEINALEHKYDQTTQNDTKKIDGIGKRFDILELELKQLNEQQSKPETKYIDEIKKLENLINAKSVPNSKHTEDTQKLDALSLQINALEHEIKKLHDIQHDAPKLPPISINAKDNDDIKQLENMVKELNNSNFKTDERHKEEELKKLEVVNKKIRGLEERGGHNEQDIQKLEMLHKQTRDLEQGHNAQMNQKLIMLEQQTGHNEQEIKKINEHQSDLVQQITGLEHEIKKLHEEIPQPIINVNNTKEIAEIQKLERAINELHKTQPKSGQPRDDRDIKQIENLSKQVRDLSTREGMNEQDLKKIDVLSTQIGILERDNKKPIEIKKLDNLVTEIEELKKQINVLQSFIEKDKAIKHDAFITAPRIPPEPIPILSQENSDPKHLVRDVNVIGNNVTRMQKEIENLNTKLNDVQLSHQNELKTTAKQQQDELQQMIQKQHDDVQKIHDQLPHTKDITEEHQNDMIALQKAHQDQLNELYNQHKIDLDRLNQTNLLLQQQTLQKTASPPNVIADQQKQVLNLQEKYQAFKLQQQKELDDIQKAQTDAYQTVQDRHKQKLTEANRTALSPDELRAYEKEIDQLKQTHVADLTALQKTHEDTMQTHTQRHIDTENEHQRAIAAAENKLTQTKLDDLNKKTKEMLTDETKKLTDLFADQSKQNKQQLQTLQEENRRALQQMKQDMEKERMLQESRSNVNGMMNVPQYYNPQQQYYNPQQQAIVQRQMMNHNYNPIPHSFTIPAYESFIHGSPATPIMRTIQPPLPIQGPMDISESFVHGARPGFVPGIVPNAHGLVESGYDTSAVDIEKLKAEHRTKEKEADRQEIIRQEQNVERKEREKERQLEWNANYTKLQKAHDDMYAYWFDEKTGKLANADFLISEYTKTLEHIQHEEELTKYKEKYKQNIEIIDTYLDKIKYKKKTLTTLNKNEELVGKKANEFIAIDALLRNIETQKLNLIESKTKTEEEYKRIYKHLLHDFTTKIQKKIENVINIKAHIESEFERLYTTTARELASEEKLFDSGMKSVNFSEQQKFVKLQARMLDMKLKIDQMKNDMKNIKVTSFNWFGFYNITKQEKNINLTIKLIINEIQAYDDKEQFRNIQKMDRDIHEGINDIFETYEKELKGEISYDVSTELELLQTHLVALRNLKSFTIYHLLQNILQLYNISEKFRVHVIYLPYLFIFIAAQLAEEIMCVIDKQWYHQLNDSQKKSTYNAQENNLYFRSLLHLFKKVIVFLKRLRYQLNLLNANGTNSEIVSTKNLNEIALLSKYVYFMYNVFHSHKTILLQKKAIETCYHTHQGTKMHITHMNVKELQDTFLPLQIIKTRLDWYDGIYTHLKNKYDTDPNVETYTTLNMLVLSYNLNIMLSLLDIGVVVAKPKDEDEDDEDDDESSLVPEIENQKCQIQALSKEQERMFTFASIYFHVNKSMKIMSNGDIGDRIKQFKKFKNLQMNEFIDITQTILPGIKTGFGELFTENLSKIGQILRDRINGDKFLLLAQRASHKIKKRVTALVLQTNTNNSFIENSELFRIITKDVVFIYDKLTMIKNDIFEIGKNRVFTDNVQILYEITMFEYEKINDLWTSIQYKKNDYFSLKTNLLPLLQLFNNITVWINQITQLFTKISSETTSQHKDLLKRAEKQLRSYKEELNIENKHLQTLLAKQQQNTKKDDDIQQFIDTDLDTETIKNYLERLQNIPIAKIGEDTKLVQLIGIQKKRVETIEEKTREIDTIIKEQSKDAEIQQELRTRQKKILDQKIQEARADTIEHYMLKKEEKNEDFTDDTIRNIHDLPLLTLKTTVYSIQDMLNTFDTSISENYDKIHDYKQTLNRVLQNNQILDTTNKQTCLDKLNNFFNFGENVKFSISYKHGDNNSFFNDLR